MKDYWMQQARILESKLGKPMMVVVDKYGTYSVWSATQKLSDGFSKVEEGEEVEDIDVLRELRERNLLEKVDTKDLIAALAGRQGVSLAKMENGYTFLAIEGVA